MPNGLSRPTAKNAISAKFFEAGFLFPISVLDREVALSHRRDLETLEQRISGSKLGANDQLNQPHVIFRFVHEIVRNPKILDVVEAILGPDILVWGSTFFIKEPHTKNYVSWHQDLRYWGLDDPNGQVSAWIALSDVTKANGCMRFVPGSHQGQILEHKDTFAEGNSLSRGQEAVVDIDQDRIAYVELEPGQASFHHGKLLHASGPNDSDDRRIGLTINYIAPHVRQSVAKQDYATLVRGTDRYRNFSEVPAPIEDLSQDSLAWHKRILSAQDEALYAGAETPTT